jgi:Ca2+-binding EF-hand superfamily protein
MKITLDRERNLKLDMNDMRLFHKVSGISIFKIGENFNEDILQALLFACLKHEDEELTFERVGELIDFSNMEYVTETIGELLNSSKKKS